MRMVCGYCNHELDSSEEDPRCPKCLRRGAAPRGKSRAPEVGDLRELSSEPRPKRPLRE